MVCGVATKNTFSTKASISPSELTSINSKTIGTSLPPSAGGRSGLSDGEGCFHLAFTNNRVYKSGFQIRAVFSIQLHKKDLKLLERIKSYFGVGTILLKKNASAAIYSIQSYRELNSVLIPHFDNYPLLTKKKADYLLFKSAVNMLNNGEHLTDEGLRNLVSIKASMNNGLTEQLKTIFPNIKPVTRPIINNSSTLEGDPHWLAGFTDAEGNFLCLVRKQVSHKSGFQVLLSFTLPQSSRDLELMKSIQNYFSGCGKIYEDTENSLVRLTITKKSDIRNIIIPFFLKYPLHGAKKLDFESFCKIDGIVKEDLHKTNEGLDIIRMIKGDMNRKRIHE